MASFLSQIAKITDNLYLSSFVGATEYNILKHNINCVITVCKEVPKVDLKHVESVKLDVLDKPTESLSKYFDYISDKINEIANKKGVCLVHCVAGISRSATMVIAYLMKYLRMSLRDAHTLVKSKRPFIRPNLGFWRQLVEYEQNLFGKTSVKIIPSNIGFIPDIYENEVKSMQWARSNPGLAGTLAAANPTTNNSNFNNNLYMSYNNSNNSYNQNYNNNNNNANTNNNNNVIMNREKQCLIGPNVANGMPKFSNSQTSPPNQFVSPNPFESQNLRLNKSNYTTTYRSSYQKP